MSAQQLVTEIKTQIATLESGKKEVLRNLDFFCLDNSIRESTVGQLRAHTLENKKEILAAVKRCGFRDIIVASFSNMPRTDDAFAQYLKDSGEDFSGFFSFSEISDSVVDGVYDTESIPISLQKNKQYGFYNTFFELDLYDKSVKWGTKWHLEDTCKLVEKWMNWVYDNINPKARILVNLRDLPDAMLAVPERVLEFVAFLAKMPKEKRMFCLAYEDPLGEFVPDEIAIFTRALRKTMDDNGWQDGKLICHIHEKWGLQNASQLAALTSGANGIWASLCEEGAALGHACSAVTLTNLVRLGNKKVLSKYNCRELRSAAELVTRVTTNAPPHPKQVVYGERVTDLVFGFLGTGSFDLAQFFGETRTNRITQLATPEMIKNHLVVTFGSNSQFTLEIAQKMKALIQKDLDANRKEEYQSPVGIALLFDRAGGTLQGPMADVIAKEKLEHKHHDALIAEVNKIWQEWDVKDGRADDESLEFDYFYHAFAAPFLGCYRCTKAKQAFSCIDMNDDGKVHWNEFAVYLKWALRQYPDINTVDELLSTAFQKGLLPAMEDELLSKAGLKDDDEEAPNEPPKPSSVRPGNLKGINGYEKEVGSRYFCWRWFTRGNDKFRVLTIEAGGDSKNVIDGPCFYRPTDFAGFAEDYYTGIEHSFFSWRNLQRGNETFWVLTIENRSEKILDSPYYGKRNVLPTHLAGCNGYEGEIAQARFYWRNFQRGDSTFRVVTLEVPTVAPPPPVAAGPQIIKLKNAETNRYVFCQAEKNEKEGSEGGWVGPKTKDKPLIGTDANYYNRAMWEVEKRGDVILLRNHESHRLIFDQAPKMQGERGAEGGWIGPNSKKALAADANYYNLALWKVQHNSNGTVTLINSQTNRMLFDTGDKFTGQPGAEGGWIAGHIKPLVTSDANYYNRAMWHVEGGALP